MFPRFDDLDRDFKRISSPVVFHKGSKKEAKLGNDYSILCLKKAKYLMLLPWGGAGRYLLPRPKHLH